jgi:hypothetical protein
MSLFAAISFFLRCPPRAPHASPLPHCSLGTLQQVRSTSHFSLGAIGAGGGTQGLSCTPPSKNRVFKRHRGGTGVDPSLPGSKLALFINFPVYPPPPPVPRGFVFFRGMLGGVCVHSYGVMWVRRHLGQNAVFWGLLSSNKRVAPPGFETGSGPH